MRVSALARKHEWQYEDIGRQQLNGVGIDLGVRTTRPWSNGILWHPLSLKAENKQRNHIALCKALVTDITEIKSSFAEYRSDMHVVVLERPKIGNMEAFDESIAWLQHGTREIIDVQDVHAHKVDSEIERYLTNGPGEHEGRGQAG